MNRIKLGIFFFFIFRLVFALQEIQITVLVEFII